MNKIVFKSVKERKKIFELIEKTLNDSKVSELTKKKMIVIKYKVDGKTINDIISKTGLSKRTIINYCNAFNSTDSYHEFFYFKNYNKQHKKSLFASNADIINEFENDVPKSYKEAKERLKAKYNVDLSISTIRRGLNKQNIYTSKSRIDKNDRQ